jgi:hypothetical protein
MRIEKNVYGFILEFLFGVASRQLQQWEVNIFKKKINENSTEMICLLCTVFVP